MMIRMVLNWETKLLKNNMLIRTEGDFKLEI